MNPANQTLWAQIEAFEFDAPDTRLTFAQRLATDNDWSMAYTRSVLLEYKRFVFLAMTSERPVCPSDAVDQAWHMHLTYTRSYWEDFCGKTLGRPLHHGPTRGGKAENVKHHDMYANTLAAYREAFGVDAPADVWHPAGVRFGEDVAFKRVNTRRNWVIPKPRWLKKAALFAGAVLALSATGCFSPSGPALIFDMKGPAFLVFFVWFSVGVFFVAAYLRKRSRGTAAVTPADYLTDDVYAVATLNGGGTAAVNTAIVELARRQFIEVQRNGTVRRLQGEQDEETLHPFELAVLNSVMSPASDLKEIRATLRSWVDGMIDHLRTRGFVMTTEQIAKSQRNVSRVLMLIPIVGITKMWIGSSNGHPVAFLAILTIIASIAAVIFYKNKPFRTKRGDEILSTLKKKQPLPQLDERHSMLNPAMSTSSLAMCAALYGTSVLAGTQMNHLNRALTPQNTGDSSGGCSSAGCGGGGDSGGGDSGGGGGCSGGGGCGGCGGGGD